MSGELKHKLYNYEVKPPQAVWNSIAGGLEEDAGQIPAPALTPLSKKMLAYEVKPPAIVWRNIVAVLKTGTPAKVIALGKIYRWTAAAAVIMIASAWYFLSHSDTAKSVVHTNTTANKPGGTEANDNDNDVAASKVFVSPVKLVSSNHSRRKVYDDEEDTKILPLSYVEDADPLSNNQTVSVTARPILTASGELIQDMSVVNPHNDKYISITAPDGQQTKVSSRLINAMRYFSNSKLDPQAKDSTLQQRIHEWRNKILQSGLVPSSGNFLDILEITDLVDEKKQQ